jgi:hypothetical protein
VDKLNTSTDLSYDRSALLFGERIIFGRSSLAEVAASQELGDQDSLKKGGKNPPEKVLIENEKSFSFLVKEFLRTFQIVFQTTEKIF